VGRVCGFSGDEDGEGWRWRLGKEKREGLLLFSMFSWTGDAAEHGKVFKRLDGQVVDVWNKRG